MVTNPGIIAEATFRGLDKTAAMGRLLEALRRDER
jgi:hypothetical protein